MAGYWPSSFLIAFCIDNIAFMQQDGRRKRMTKYLCVINITGLLLSCAVVIFGQELIFFGLLQKDIWLKEDEV